MSIRYAILGLLADQPMHGYRLKETFHERMSPLWGLTTGQIYQSLAALERSAFITSYTERKSKRPARRVYSVTEAGKRGLAAWLQLKPDAATRSFREETLIRLMMLREEDAAPLWRSLARQEEDARIELTRITRMRTEPRPNVDTIDLRAIFLEGMAHSLEADIRNLQHYRRAIEEWAQQRGGAAILRDRDIPGHWSLGAAASVFGRTRSRTTAPPFESE